jgi:hypothetical protein
VLVAGSESKERPRLTRCSYRRIGYTIVDWATLEEGVYWMIVFMIPHLV